MHAEEIFLGERSCTSYIYSQENEQSLLCIEKNYMTAVTPRLPTVRCECVCSAGRRDIEFVGIP